MKTNRTPYYSFLLVLMVHTFVLGLVLLAPAKSQSLEMVPPEIVPPTIQGVIVVMQTPTSPPAALPPPLSQPEQSQPEQLPKQKTLIQKTSQSEPATQHYVEPESVAPHTQKNAQPVLPVSSEQLVPPHIDASHMNNSAPVYPAISRRLREEGVVILEILVLASGAVGELHVKQSSGYSRLDETAKRAVKNWHFVPAKRGDEAIDFWYELPIDFSLKQQQ